METRSLLSIEAKVILLAVLNAALMASGAFFQKLNGMRGGSVLLSGWVVAAAACLVPTFFVGNIAFAMGGRMSVFVPATALTYVLTIATGRVAFGELVEWDKLLGCFLILAGVALVARR